MLMDTPKQNSRLDSKKIRDWLVTLVLFAITIALGLLVFLTIPLIATMVVNYLPDQSLEISRVQEAGMVATANNVGTMVGGLLLLVVSVGGMEFHFKNRGRRRSYRIFAWTIGIELAIVAAHQILIRVLVG